MAVVARTLLICVWHVPKPAQTAQDGRTFACLRLIRGLFRSTEVLLGEKQVSESREVSGLEIFGYAVPFSPRRYMVCGNCRWYAVQLNGSQLAAVDRLPLTVVLRDSFSMLPADRCLDVARRCAREF